MLEMVLVLAYLVFMFGIPVTTEKVWIDSVATIQQARRRETAFCVPAKSIAST